MDTALSKSKIIVFSHNSSSIEKLYLQLNYFFQNHFLQNTFVRLQLYRRIADIMEVFQTEQKVSYIETTFLENAVNRLCEARRTLMYTVSFSYKLFAAVTIFPPIPVLVCLLSEARCKYDTDF